MLHKMIRVLVFVAAVFAGLVMSAGPASAVSPAQCEEDGAFVDVRLDPTDSSKAICTCRGGRTGIYDGLQVWGPHMFTLNNAPMVVTCVGLEVA
ncbi:hypothetical protein [Nocardia sp. IFM 10818]